MIFIQCLYKNVGFIFWLYTAFFNFGAKYYQKRYDVKGLYEIETGAGVA